MDQQQSAKLSNLDKRKPKNPIKFKIELNEEQKNAKAVIYDNPVVLIRGYAGSGKTACACQVALDMFFKRQVEKIIITRPTVAKEEIGFLPGDMKDKMDPWLAPVYANLHGLYGREAVDKLALQGDIEIVPFAFMRGRAQPLHSRVLTPHGFVQMGDVKVGDSILGQDGQPYEVLGVFPQGVMDVYRVEFTDGTSVLASDDHLWEVVDMAYQTKKTASVRTTKEIRQQLKLKNGQLKWKIPLMSPAIFPTANLPIDPYMLGLLLGDGCLVNQILFSTKDLSLVEEIQSRLPSPLKIKKKAGDNYDYGISAGRTTYASRDQRNQLKHALSDLGLLGKHSWDKFIPDLYLHADPHQRIELLRGLMDTDGSIYSDGIHSRKTSSVSHYYTVSEKLRDGVSFLVQSLGGVVKVRKYHKAGTVDEWGRKYNYDLYDLFIRMPSSINPFKLTRKADLFEVIQEPRRGIMSIEWHSSEPVQCIAVSAPNKLYITDNFTVTHNTFVNAFVLVDECQNITHTQTEMMLGRLGKGSKMVFCGDVAQIDLKNKKDSGIGFFLRLEENVPGVRVVTLKTNHRHEVVEPILQVYTDYRDM